MRVIEGQILEDPSFSRNPLIFPWFQPKFDVYSDMPARFWVREAFECPFSIGRLLD